MNSCLGFIIRKHRHGEEGKMTKIIGSIIAIGLLFLVSAYPAHAASVIFDLDPFTDSPGDALVTVDDETAGAFRVNVQVIPWGVEDNIGDITGVFFDLSDLIIQDDINMQFGGNIMGFANNIGMSGGGPDNPGLFDVGLEYAGLNIDDIQEMEFLIDLTRGPIAGLGLGLDDFDKFGLRLQSVGPTGADPDDREGSSKLAGFSGGNGVIPEPTTMLLLGSGLLGLALARRKKRS